MERSALHRPDDPACAIALAVVCVLLKPSCPSFLETSNQKGIPDLCLNLQGTYKQCRVSPTPRGVLKVNLRILLAFLDKAAELVF